MRNAILFDAFMQWRRDHAHKILRVDRGGFPNIDLDDYVRFWREEKESGTLRGWEQVVVDHLITAYQEEYDDGMEQTDTV